MKINRNNYEQYLIDYLDGNLDPGQVEILLSFLEFNTDLREELEGLERAYLIPAEQQYINKENLIKADYPFEEGCIDFIEGRLNEAEEKQFRQLVSEDSSREVTLKLYQSTLMVPDMSIQYPDKSDLIKLTFRKTLVRLLTPVAAAAAVLIGALVIFNQESNLPGSSDIPISETTEHTEETVKSPIGETSYISQVSPLIESRKPTPVGKSGPSSGNEILRETMNLSRIKPLGITRVMAVSAIPSYALMHKLNEDPGRLEQLALNQVDEGLQATMSMPEKARNALWRLADASVRGLNQIAEEDVELDRRIDENGKTRSFRFETEFFGISTPLQNLPAPE